MKPQSQARVGLRLPPVAISGSPLFLWQMYTDFEVIQDSLRESLQSTQSTLKKNKNSILIGIPSTTPSCDGSGFLFGQREKISKPVNSLGVGLV